MKTRKTIIAGTLALSMIIGFAACKKESTEDSSTNSTTTGSTTSSNTTTNNNDDYSNVNSNVNKAMDDINTSLSGTSIGTGKTNGYIPICGASLDTALRAQGTLVINYDGTSTCDGLKRSGSITVNLANYASGKRWKDVGAKLSVTFTNYKITRTYDNKSLTFNGTESVTNVSGGQLIDLLLLGSGTTRVHKLRGTNLQVTFDDGTTRTWQHATQRTYTNIAGVYKLSIAGDTTLSTYNNVDTWGITRDNKSFTNYLSAPIVVNTICGALKPTEGVSNMKVGGNTLVTTFGVDSSGNPVTTSGSTCTVWGIKCELYIGSATIPIKVLFPYL